MKATQADPTQPKISGIFSATTKEKKRTKKIKSKGTKNFGDDGKKKRKERDDAWSKVEDNTFDYGDQTMDIDIEETDNDMNTDEEMEENEETSPLEGWLTEDKSDYGDLFDENNEIDDEPEVESENDHGNKDRTTDNNEAARKDTDAENGTRTEIDLTKGNDDDESDEETEEKYDDRKKGTEATRKEDKERNKGKKHNGKKNVRNGTSKTKEKTSKETTMAEKDKNEKIKTPTPKKRLGSEITNFKKVNSRSSNRRTCKIKKGNEKLNDDDTPDKSNKSLYPHVEITRVSLKLKVPAAQDKRGAAMNVLRELFTQLKKIDKTTQIYTWAEDNEKAHGRIKEPAEIGDMKSMQLHSSKLFVFENQSDMTLYPQIRLGHDMSLEDIREGIRDWG